MPVSARKPAAAVLRPGRYGRPERRGLTHAVAAAFVVGSVLLAGCTGSTAPPASTSTWPGTASSTSSPPTTPTTTTSTTTAASDLAVKFPKTKRGAEDFVRFLLAQVSKAYTTADPTLIQPLMDVKTCPDCARWVSATTNMKKLGRHFEGVFVELQSVHALTLKGDATGVITQVLVPAGKIVDSQGRLVDPRSASGPLRSDYFLQFRDHWVVTNAEVVR